jgi:uncharacterized protein (TIGR00369 family)
MSNPLHHTPPDKGQAWFIDVVPYNRALGLRYVGSGIGHVAFDLPWQAELVGDPESGLMHGGVVTGMIDAACGGAVLSRLPRLCRVATLDLRIDYLRPARTRQALHCVAECHRLTRHIAFARASCHDGDAEDVLATAVGTFVVFGEDQRSHPRAGDPNAWEIPQ